ncbi:ATP-binding protein [Roseomonas sp. HJA6]|uniref:ATP-binding protein n=1 Tax=Roseomonas alba TaxID=2846776 RepID=A0ABS7ACG8_9PROT|nr:ATP-binding protein [Neoroseomonas alba]MBW6400001.1 ATP-binding protein [Neoroseomonas alba]
MFEWLTELRAADELRAAKLVPRSTCLLHGPPGCGKTTLAHHLAARLGIPMVLIGAESVHGSAYFGESERGVRQIFDALEAAETPCVVFMDEMESWGGNRNMNRGGGADNARTSTLGVVLRKIEEFRGILLGATNRPEDIDPALWRRFGLQMSVDLPTDEERFAILARYLRPWALPDDALDVFVDVTEGASPALLRGVAEGLKRALILGPRMGRPAEELAAILRRIIVAVRPPPEILPPALWGATDAAIGELASIAWPPVRADGGDA